jgi:hypothetical protein
LVDTASEAARVAERAALDADAVNKQLGRAQDAIQSAQVDVSSAEDKIAAARGLILAEQSRVLRERYIRLADEYREARCELKALDQLLDPPQWGP